MKKHLHVCLVLTFVALGAQAVPPKVDAVRFTGNAAFDDNRLLKSMLTRPSGFLRASPFHEHLLEDDVKAVMQFYRRNGYLEADVSVDSVSRHSESHSVSIHLSVREGVQTQVDAVLLVGHRTISENPLRPLLRIRPGDGLNMNRIEQSALALLRFYAEAGFVACDVRPEIQIDSAAHRAVVRFMILEGRPHTIGGISMDGLDKTRPQTVRRELLFQEGDLLRYSRLLESQRRLYMTGLFESVFIQPDTARSDGEQKDIHIQVREADTKEMNLLFGYGSVDRLRGQMEIQNRNAGGMGRRHGLKLKVSAITQHVEAAWSEPWLFGRRMRMDVVGFMHRQEEPGFDYQRSGGNLVFSRKLSERMQIHIEGRADRTRFLEIRIRDAVTEANRISSLKLTAKYDSRNSLYNPSSGMFFENSIETGRVFTAASLGFTRVRSDLRGVVNLNRYGVWASGIEGGWMFIPKGPGNVPLQERFYAGGPNSVRGIAYRRVGPLDAGGVPTGGRLMLVWHVLEIRKTVWRSLGMAFFSDCGQVWANDRSMDIRDLRWSAGLGMRFNTPVGLIRAEYGWVLYRKRGEETGQWVFSLGQAF